MINNLIPSPQLFRSDIERCGKILIEFVRHHFGSDEFTTHATEQDCNRLTIGFGYMIDGVDREEGHVILGPDVALDLCIIFINDFAKKRFMEHLETIDFAFDGSVKN